MGSPRVLVLGIDGASPQLIHEWSRDGSLPNLAGLLQRGQSAPTHGLDGFFIGSTWPSIHTGTTPARHGFHYQVQLKPGSYDVHRPADSGLIHVPPFWTALSAAGRRVAILDAPLSPIDPSLNGMQIVEWGGHDALYGFQTQPAHLAATIQSRFGDHPIGPVCDKLRSSADDYAQFVTALARGVATKSEMTRHFLQQGEWDFFMQVFSEAHCAGHQCWHLHDASHPAHDAALRRALGDPLRRVYQCIDTAIGEILAQIGACTTFVFSSHGMSHWYGAQFLLPEILSRLKVCERLPASQHADDKTSWTVAVGTWAWHQLPIGLRRRLRGARQRYGPTPAAAPRADVMSVDVSRSQCFHHRNGLVLGGIRLNLAGREPQGVLTPGAEADAFCQQLTRDLLAIVDERSSKPLIRRVLRTADLYQGPHLNDLPDLVVDYNDELATGSAAVSGGSGASVRVSSDKIGVLEGANTFGRTGEHRAQGLLIADGPGIDNGALNGSISLLDLAPTWARVLGVDLIGADGVPIAGVHPIV